MYLNIFNDYLQSVLKEAAFEDKYQVDVKRNCYGVITEVKKRELSDPLLDEKSNELAERKALKRKKNRVSIFMLIETKLLNVYINFLSYFKIC